MAVIALTNAFAHVGGHDFTCDTNQIELSADAAALDVTTFCSNGWTEVIGGVKSSRIDMAGFWQAGADSVDLEAFTNLGTANQVVTIGPAATETTRCYIVRAKSTNYQMFGSHGEAAPFTLAAAGSDGYGVIESQLAVAKTTVAATGDVGSGCQLGAVAADEYLYATFHVFSAGTTITAVVESDDNAGFTTPTTRATFGPITTTGGTWATRVAGAITDDYFRINVTAITGSFDIAAAIGIG